MELIGGEKPLRLTHIRSGFICCTSWSPDGREIAFGLCDDRGGSVMTVAALGGPPRKLTDAPCLYGETGWPVWMADGKSLIVVGSCKPSRSARNCAPDSGYRREAVPDHAAGRPGRPAPRSLAQSEDAGVSPNAQVERKCGRHLHAFTERRESAPIDCGKAQHLEADVGGGRAADRLQFFSWWLGWDMARAGGRRFCRTQRPPIPKSARSPRTDDGWSMCGRREADPRQSRGRISLRRAGRCSE